MFNKNFKDTIMKKYILTINALLFLAFTSIAQIDRSTPPEAGPAPKINLEKPQTFTLENGLKVMIVENHKLPRVNMTLLLDNPPHSEGEKAGVSTLTGGLLGTGTAKTSKDEFNEEVDYLGARLNFSASSANANTLSKFFPRVLELMAEGALEPEFTQEEFEKLQQRQIENLESNEKDVAFNEGRLRRALIYGKDHPYGEFSTPETLEAVSLEEVETYYNTYFVPENAYLAIIGDVDFDEAKKLVEENFSNWESKDLPKEELPEVKNVETTQINILDMPNAVQSQIAVVNSVDFKKKNSDYFPAIIANQILGGGGDARLFMNLREDKGYTYGAYSSLGNDKYKAAFTATAQVRNEVTDSSVVAFLEEIHRIRTEKVSEKELQNAKNKYVGNFVLSLEQPSTIARYALDIETEDLPEDFYETYLQKINDVTVEDVQRVAQKYFKLDQARIVVAGKASEIAENLEKIEWEGKNIPVKYYNKLGGEIEKPQAREVDPSVTAEQIYQKYIEAIGGRDAVEKIKSVVMKAEASVQGMALNLILKRTQEGKLNQEVSVGGNVMSKQVFDGENGFVVAQGQKIPYNEDQVKAAKFDANPFPELDTADASVEGIEEVEGEEAYVVAVNPTVKAFYSVESGLKIKTVQTVSQGGQSMSVPTGYSDYQVVEGVKFPFKMTQAAGPQTFEFDVTEILINEGISAEDFQ